ncbi:MAG: FAD-dependent oxidoreductase [Thermomicrobiales bacterium]
MTAAETVEVAPVSSGLKWRGDIVVVGAGIVGLAVAREWLIRNPGTRLMVLDKEPEIAAHQSGHNSGVIHSGIYYTPGSLKARACVAGAARMMTYCDEHEIPYRLCGKMIIATEEEELPRLEALFERGQANSVPGLEMIEAGRLKEIEPHAVGLKAIWSPKTGIVDYRLVAKSYAGEIERSGGEIRHRPRSSVRAARGRDPGFDDARRLRDIACRDLRRPLGRPAGSAQRGDRGR